jgi:hypothetical protein
MVYPDVRKSNLLAVLQMDQNFPHLKRYTGRTVARFADLQVPLCPTPSNSWLKAANHNKLLPHGSFF